MATPTLGNIPATISTAESTTGWTGDTFSLEPDIKVQGSNSVACAITPNAAASQEIYYTGFTAADLSTVHLRMWGNITFGGNLQTEANNGWQLFISDGTNTAYWTVAGSDTYAGGWRNFVVYTGDTPTEGTKPTGNSTRVGMRFKVLTKPRNVPANAWFDAWYYGDGYYATAGTSGDEITLDTIAAVDLTNAYGVVTKEANGSISIRGDVQIGNGATTTWFKMDNEEAFFPVEAVNTGLYKFSGNGAGCRISITDASFKAAGTAAKDLFDFDMSETNLLTMSMTASKLTRADAVNFKSGQTATNNIFNNCGVITHGGADMDNALIKNYEGTVSTGALLYNVATDPDGELDNATFEKGTAATHAMQFGTSAPLTMTLRGLTALSYNASDGQNDSTFLFPDTGSDVTWTLNLIGSSGNMTYKKARTGDTVSLVIDPVTVLVTVRDQETKVPIQYAAVTIKAGNTVGGLPFEDSVTIVQTAGVATVTHTGHGLDTGQKVEISGADQNNYNRIKTITVTGANTYTFPVDSGTASPATGTIIATAIIIDGETDVNGQISDSRTYSVDQDYTGLAQQGTRIPIYKAQPLAGEIDSAIGAKLNTLLIKD